MSRPFENDVKRAARLLRAKQTGDLREFEAAAAVVGLSVEQADGQLRRLELRPASFRRRVEKCLCTASVAI